MHSNAQATEALKARRKAAYVMNMFCRTLGLGSMAELFDAEYDEEWIVVHMGHIKCLKNKKLVSEVWIVDGVAEAVVSDAFMLIRSEHLKDFRPEQYDIEIKKSRDFTGEKDPDLTMTGFMLPESIPGLDDPPQPRPRIPRAIPPKVIRSL